MRTTQFPVCQLDTPVPIFSTMPACPAAAHRDRFESSRLTGTGLAFSARRNLFALAAAAMFVLPMQLASAATLSVGVGGCTLVDAITAANTDKPKGHCQAGKGADTVVLPRNSVHTLTAVHHRSFYGAGNGLPEITSQITIQGNGSTIRRRPDAEPFRLFEVDRGSLTILHTTLTGGRVKGSGGAISSYAGVVTLRNCTVSGNTAIRVPRIGTPTSEYGGFGGGIDSSDYYGESRLDVIDSTVSGNTATFAGGIGVQGRLRMVNSTVSANSADDDGGGIVLFDPSPQVTSTIRNSTISGNSASFAAGVYSTAEDLLLSHSTITNNVSASGGALASVGGAVLTNSIVAGNPGSDVHSTNGRNVFQSLGSNLIGTGNARGDFKARGDRTGVTDPKLEPLADNGGPTLTHALRSDSPAVDAVTGTCRSSETDQRGFSRPVDGDRNGKAKCDIGAFELDGKPPD